MEKYTILLKEIDGLKFDLETKTKYLIILEDSFNKIKQLSPDSNFEKIQNKLKEKKHQNETLQSQYSEKKKYFDSEMDTLISDISEKAKILSFLVPGYSRLYPSVIEALQPSKTDFEFNIKPIPNLDGTSKPISIDSYINTRACSETLEPTEPVGTNFFNKLIGLNTQ
jgi:hypothetical protein